VDVFALRVPGVGLLGVAAAGAFFGIRGLLAAALLGKQQRQWEQTCMHYVASHASLDLQQTTIVVGRTARHACIPVSTTRVSHATVTASLVALTC
jgi:hypothetical protein